MPRLLQIPSIRRGASDVLSRFFADANTGVIESSSGSASMIPVARRKRRRDIAERVDTNGACIALIDGGLFIDIQVRELERLRVSASFLLEQFTLHQFLNDGADAVMACLSAVEDAFDGLAIG